MVRFGKTGAAALVYVSLAVAQRGISLFILPFVTHAMSPAEYGAASTMSAASILITTVIATPLIPLIIRAAARKDENGPSLLRAAGTYCYYIVPIAVLPIAAAFTFFAHDFLGVPGFIWGIEILSIGLQPAAGIFALWVSQAREDLAKFVLISSTSVVLTLLGKLLFVVILRLGVLGWAISDLVGALLTAMLAVAIVRLPRAKVYPHQIRYLISFTLPLLPHSASLWALNSLSRPAMAAVTPLDQVGLFSFGLNLAAVAGLALVEGNRAVLPRYSREDLPAPTRETLGPVRWQLVAAFVVPAFVGAGVASAGQWIFAESYWPAFVFTGILLLGQTAYGLYAVPMNYLTQTAGLTRYSALASGAGAVTILAGILLLGRRYGAMGIAFTTTVAFLAMASVALILTIVHHLDIAWHSWLPDWPTILLGVLSLACSVSALFSTVGSARAWSFVGACVIFGLGSGLLAVKTGTPKIDSPGGTI